MTEWLNNLSPTQSLLLFTSIKAVVCFAIMMTMVAYTVVLERRLCAWIQGRIGPNRVGPLGLLQPAADGIKAFFKEEMTPAHVRKVFFTLAPMIALAPAILNLAVIPFGSNLGGQKMVLADLNVGILYTFGIVSLGVYSIVLAGYASNSKFPFLGGIRSSAQMISYEIAMVACKSSCRRSSREATRVLSGSSCATWFTTSPARMASSPLKVCSTRWRRMSRRSTASRGRASVIRA